MTVTEPGDAVDRILLFEARTQFPSVPGPIVVLDDESGVLTSELAEDGTTGPVRRYHDSLLAEREATEYLRKRATYVPPAPELNAELLADAELVVLRLPKSLAALDEMAQAVAQYAAPEVTLLAGGRTRHMTRSMNDVLGQHFESVAGSLGRQKCRVLTASGPQAGPAIYPVSADHPDLGVTLSAYGGAFAGTGVDLGSRLMVSCFDELPSSARIAIDLGCGTGLLAAACAQRLPDVQVVAVDESRTAVRSTRATAAANGLDDRIRVELTDGLEQFEDDSVDLIVCNPPFHRGTAKDSAAAYAMIDSAGRCLRPGGELWTVYNSHLPYLRALRRAVGRTSVLAQNPSYMVARSVRGR